MIALTNAHMQSKAHAWLSRTFISFKTVAVFVRWPGVDLPFSINCGLSTFDETGRWVLHGITSARRTPLHDSTADPQGQPL